MILLYQRVLVKKGMPDWNSLTFFIIPLINLSGIFDLPLTTVVWNAWLSDGNQSVLLLHNNFWLLFHSSSGFLILITFFLSPVVYMSSLVLSSRSQGLTWRQEFWKLVIVLPQYCGKVLKICKIRKKCLSWKKFRKNLQNSESTFSLWSMS